MFLLCYYPILGQISRTFVNSNKFSFPFYRTFTVFVLFLSCVQSLTRRVSTVKCWVLYCKFVFSIEIKKKVILVFVKRKWTTSAHGDTKAENEFECEG